MSRRRRLGYWLLFGFPALCALASLVVAAVAHQDPVHQAEPSDDAEPPAAAIEIVEVVVIYVPSVCGPKCGTHWVYVFWSDGMIERRLCDDEDCGPWEVFF